MKFAPRAIIDDGFITIMLEAYRIVLNRKTTELEHGNRYGNTTGIQPVINRLTPILNGVNDGRSGMDYEKTRLRILPFTHFSALDYGGQFWMIGQTHPIIIKATETDYETRKAFTMDYHLGPYKVCIPFATFNRRGIDGVHFVPLKNPLCYNRHPHHHANWRDYNDQTINHPLENNPSTCWGNYGSLLAALVADGDIPELFRQFYVYLTRYNASSPLIGSGYSLNHRGHGIQCVGFDYTQEWKEK